jgi:hypothetical protein
MTFTLLLRDSNLLTWLFFVLVALAVLTQHSSTESVPYVVRGPIKAGPALLLAVLSLYFAGPPLLTMAFVLCAIGDFLLDIPKPTLAWAFEAGAAVFAAALICLSLTYLGKPLAGRPLLPLSVPNIVLALFVCIWLFTKVKTSLRMPALSYLAILVVSNVIASTSLVPIFLGSTLWLISDLSIGISRHIPGTPSNGPTNMFLYSLGLYFIALGCLNV